MQGDDMTIGELARRMESLDRAMGQGFARIDGAIESLRFVHSDVYHTEQKGIESRLAALEDRSKWVTRSLGGVLFTLIATALVVLITARGGL